MLNPRKNLFPLQNVSTMEAFSLIGAALITLVAGTGSTSQREKFELSFGKYIDDGEPVGFPSGRSALAALLMTNGVQRGGEVLLTGFTCEAVAQAVVAIGAKPTWVDVELETLSMNPILAKKAVTSSTQAIVVQHSFGIPTPLGPFTELAKENSFALIEDCCLALGSRHKDGSPVGTGEHDAFWSFEVTKTISAGWGGVALIKDQQRSSAILQMRDSAPTHGRLNAAKSLVQAAMSSFTYRSRFSSWLAYIPAVMERLRFFSSSDDRIGGMVSPTPFSDYGAAGPDATWKTLTRQLDRMPAQIKRIQSNNKIFFDAFSELGIQRPESWVAETAVLLRIPILVKNREKFESHMLRNGIDTGRWFDTPISAENTSNPFGYTPGTCPVGERLAGAITNLPTHANMNTRRAESTVNTMTEYFLANKDEYKVF